MIVPAEPARAAAKLLDFGVAHLAGDEPLTRTGDVVGTLAYMAPEQAAGERVDERADLYSLALVLYEALAGTNPVRAPSPAETARRVGTRLPSLRRQRRDLPADLCARARSRAGAASGRARHARRPRGGPGRTRSGRRRRGRDHRCRIRSRATPAARGCGRLAAGLAAGGLAAAVAGGGRRSAAVAAIGVAVAVAAFPRVGLAARRGGRRS